MSSTRNFERLIKLRDDYRKTMSDVQAEGNRAGTAWAEQNALYVELVKLQRDKASSTETKDDFLHEAVSNFSASNGTKERNDRWKNTDFMGSFIEAALAVKTFVDQVE